MNRLHGRHRTEIRYAGPVAESVNEARLVPRSWPGQRVIEARLRIEPVVEVADHVDLYGNTVSWFQIDVEHESLVVEAEAVVESISSPPPSEHADAWAVIESFEHADAFADFLLPSPRVTWGGALTALAEELWLDESGGVVEWLRAVEAGVNASIVYASGTTHVDTPIDQVLRARHGVCQDMAHVAIALCRQRGVPARYVSGWMLGFARDEPAESHAWLQAHVPGAGWIDLDPTHPDPDWSHYVRVAVGRDYGDVSPLRGSYTGPPTLSLEVEVEVLLEER